MDSGPNSLDWNETIRWDQVRIQPTKGINQNVVVMIFDHYDEQSVDTALPSCFLHHVFFGPYELPWTEECTHTTNVEWADHLIN